MHFNLFFLIDSQWTYWLKHKFIFSDQFSIFLSNEITHGVFMENDIIQFLNFKTTIIIIRLSNIMWFCYNLIDCYSDHEADEAFNHSKLVKESQCLPPLSIMVISHWFLIYEWSKYFSYTILLHLFPPNLQLSDNRFDKKAILQRK